MPDIITWYDVLGVTAGASPDTIQRAYDARRGQLSRALFSGAPPQVLPAAERARESVETAWQVLSDPARRHQYDGESGVRVRGPRGLAPGRPRRGLLVPDLRGLFYQPCQAVVTMAGLRMTVVRLTADPAPVEGLVVGQSPLLPGRSPRTEVC